MRIVYTIQVTISHILQLLTHLKSLFIVTVILKLLFDNYEINSVSGIRLLKPLKLTLGPGATVRVKIPW